MSELNIEKMLTSYVLTTEEKDFLDQVTEIEMGQYGHISDTENKVIRLNRHKAVPMSLKTISRINPNHLSHVTKFSLTDFRSDTVPDFVFGLANLEDLELNMVISPQTLQRCTNLAKLRKLSLIDSSLSEIPAIICQLKNLEELNLSHNSIRNVPEDITQLKKLKKLSLNANELYSVPEEIFFIPSLTELDLSSNGLTSVPESIKNAVNLQHLSLQYNCFSEFPDEILSLSGLRSLNLEKSLVYRIPEKILQLTQLRALNLKDNGIAELPESFSKLTELRFLECSGNQFERIPDSVFQLTNLSRLYFDANKLSDLPEDISKLTSLNTLSLGFNKLSALPDSIEKLRNLKTLELSYNEFSEFPKITAKLTSLTHLSLSHNRISTVLSEQGGFEHLELLDVSENPMTDISFAGNHLSSVKYIDLSGTRIEILPEFIRRCTKLQKLDISSTSIKELPDWLQELTCLTALNISELTLRELPFLPSVYQYCPARTRLTANLGEGLYKENTTLLMQPASLFDQPFELIEEYYKSEKIRVSEAKIIFIGNGKKGKTYTLQRILNHDEPDDYKTEQTHGINICDYHTRTNDGKDLKITFWDFGGQHIMHSMHQCFLTERTGYVIFLDTRDDDGDMQAEKWIKSIKSFAPASRILVYENLWDNEKRRRVTERYLKDMYGVDVISCSSKCASREEFTQRVTKPIIDLAVSLDSYVMTIPEKWNGIRHELLDLRNRDTYYLTLNQYFEICRNHGENDRHIAAWLLDLFNDMGECFSFGDNALEDSADNHTVLNEYRVLEPKWLTKGIYTIIQQGEEDSDNGRIKRSRLISILKKVDPDDVYEILPVSSYTDTEVDYILEIMRKFSMSYQINEQQEFIPSLVSPSDDRRIQLEPESFAASRKYEFEYEYLPTALIHQVMVECYRKNIQPTRVWSRGFVFDSEMHGIFLVVDGNGSDNVLRVSIYTLNASASPQNPLQWMLNVIRSVSKRLNLTPDEWVLPEDGVRDRISIKELNDILACGETVYSCPDKKTRTMKKYSIPDLLCMFIDKNIAQMYLQSNYRSHDYSQEKLTSYLEQRGPVNLTVNNYYNYGQGNQVINTAAYNQILRSMTSDPARWLTMLSEHPELLSNDILDQLGSILKESKDAGVKEAGEKIQKTGSEKEKKTLFTRTVDRMKGVNEGFKFADNAVKYWPYIIQAAGAIPALWDLFIHLH